VSAELALANYVQGATFADVGVLRMFEGSQLRRAVSSRVLVRDARMPPVAVQRHSADVQSTAYVMNIQHDSDYIRTPFGTVPPSIFLRFFQIAPDNFDFIAIVGPGDTFRPNFYAGVRNGTRGLGIGTFDTGLTFGSAARLQGVIHLTSNWWFDLSDYLLLHEIGHRWSHYSRGTLFETGLSHWPIASTGDGIMGSPGRALGGTAGSSGTQYMLEPLPSGDAVVRCSQGRAGFSYAGQGFNAFELYFMGLLPADSVPPALVVRNQPTTPVNCGSIVAGPIDTVRVTDVVAFEGQRLPDVAQSQRAFSLATIVLSVDRLLTADEMAYFDYAARRGESRSPISDPITNRLPFFLATGARATLSTRIR
jgi:hypothetical protein